MKTCRPLFTALLMLLAACTVLSGRGTPTFTPAPTFTPRPATRVPPTPTATQPPAPSPTPARLSSWEALPPGMYLAYTGGGFGEGIFVLSPDQSYSGRLLEDPRAGPALAPDGSRLAYGAPGWVSWAALNLPENRLEMLPAGACSFYTASPDLDLIAANCGPEQPLCLLQPGGEPACLASTWPEVFTLTTAAFSPNGRWLAFFIAPNGLYVGSGESPTGLYLLETACWQEPQGCDQARRGPFYRLDVDLKGPLAWSPDGQTIAVLGQGQSPVLLFDREKGLFASLAVSGGTGPLNSLAWSPDGHWLAYARAEKGSSGMNALYIQPATGGKATQLLRSPWELAVRFWLQKPDPHVPPSYFQLGDVYRVSEAGDDLNLRSSPTLYSNPILKLQSGSEVVVLEGPVKENAYDWWRVQVLPNGPEGWAVENPEWFLPAEEDGD